MEFSVHSVTEGIDAIGEVSVRIEAPGMPTSLDAQHETTIPRTFGGYGADTDIIVAGAKAYLAALNKVLVDRTEKTNSSELGTGVKHTTNPRHSETVETTA